MEITETQHNINRSNTACRASGNVNHSNLQILNAILYVTEHGCKWRGLPKRFGNWHAIYYPTESMGEKWRASKSF